MLSREQLLAGGKRPTKVITLPSMGGDVILRGFSAEELVDFQKWVALKKGEKFEEMIFASKLVVRCLVDESGNRVLTDDDWKLVKEWPALEFRVITNAALEINGLRDPEEGNS